jgi:hypothetical protein
MKRHIGRRLWATGFASAVALAMTVSLSTRTVAQDNATIAADEMAGYLVFPKVVSDPTDMFEQGRRVDTMIKITNTSTQTRVVHCIYVNATGFCSNGESRFSPDGFCRDKSDCFASGVCEPDWRGVQDFSIVLSPRQPTGWRVSDGAIIAEANNGLDPVGGGEVNPIPLEYFIGELKCLQVDGTSIAGSTLHPINANDLKGEAKIYELESGVDGRVDVRGYSALGVQAVAADNVVQGDRVLCLGASNGSAECTAAEYASCPARMILDHYFDGATVEAETGSSVVTTDLTLVPCSENIANPLEQTAAVAQFLVFNEFEQRMSGSTTVDCFIEKQLSHLDKRSGQEAFSIFNVAVQGTLAGQTIIRPVPETASDRGIGLLGIGEQFHWASAEPVGSAAFHLNYVGENTGSGDFVRYDVPLPEDDE